jgi:hypothetical protein
MHWPLPNSASATLVSVIDDLGLWLDECPAPDGPTSLYVACASEQDAVQLAGRLSIDYTYGVAEQLAAMLPPLESYARLWPEGDLPRGFDAERFDTADFRWKPVANGRELGHGAYRCRTYEGHVHAIHGPLGWRRVVKELGIYEVLRWEKASAVHYDAERLVLTVPAAVALPALHARAATLCSGRLPTFRREVAQLEYRNVASGVAGMIANSLSQEVFAA